MKIGRGVKNMLFHVSHLPSLGPKQLCALAYLGCNRKAGTSLSTSVPNVQNKLLKSEFFNQFQKWNYEAKSEIVGEKRNLGI